MSVGVSFPFGFQDRACFAVRMAGITAVSLFVTCGMNGDRCQLF